MSIPLFVTDRNPCLSSLLLAGLDVSVPCTRISRACTLFRLVRGNSIHVIPAGELSRHYPYSRVGLVVIRDDFGHELPALSVCEDPCVYHLLGCGSHVDKDRVWHLYLADNGYLVADLAAGGTLSHVNSIDGLALMLSRLAGVTS